MLFYFRRQLCSIGRFWHVINIQTINKTTRFLFGRSVDFFPLSKTKLFGENYQWVEVRNGSRFYSGRSKPQSETLTNIDWLVKISRGPVRFLRWTYRTRRRSSESGRNGRVRSSRRALSVRIRLIVPTILFDTYAPIGWV